MASRFRKIAITAVGVCAGTGLTAWSLSRKVDSPYQVCDKYKGAVQNELQPYAGVYFRCNWQQPNQSELAGNYLPGVSSWLVFRVRRNSMC